MEFNSKVTILFVFFLFIAICGCTTTSTPPASIIQTSASQEISGPIIITKPGLYQLTNDLVPSTLDKFSPQEYVCINIRSSDVIFDGMGHVIDGKNIILNCEWSNTYNRKICEFSYGIRSSIPRDKLYQYSNIVVKNVTVSNWSEGFRFAGIKNIFLENSVSSYNGGGLRLFYTSNITLFKNTFSNNKASGIEGSDNEKLTINENSITNNGNTGIVLNGIIQSSVKIPVPGPVQFIFGNQLVLYPFTTIEKPSTSNGGHVIQQNTIGNNRGDGIMLKDSAGNYIEQNRILDNQRSGIRFDKVDSTTVESNTIANNSNAISLSNCGPDINLVNNTLIGNKQNVERYNYNDSIPLTIIIGTILVYLIKVLSGTSKVAQKIGSSKILKRFSEKFKPTEEKISAALNNLKISFILKNNIAVSLLGACVLGGAFTYIYLSSFGLKIEVFAALTFIGGIVMIVPRAVQYLAANKGGMSAEYRMWWGGLLVIFLTTSLLNTVFGLPVRTAIEKEDEYEKKNLALTMLAGPLVSLVLSASFLLLFLMKGTYASLALTGLNMSLLSAFVSFLPISPMEGERVFKWNKLVWVVVFAPILLAYGYFLILH
jgi:parallel beta-helix repeat protein